MLNRHYQLVNLQFKWMLSQSHLAAALFKSIFGLIGFLTFAEFTQKEISNSVPNQAFKVLINLVLVIKALLSYPLPFYAIVQLLTDNFFRGISKTVFTRLLVNKSNNMLTCIPVAMVLTKTYASGQSVCVLCCCCGRCL